MLNSVVLQGKVMNDIKIKDVDGGRSLVLFTIAHSRDALNEKGERLFDNIDIIAWGELAYFISSNFKKGDEIIIQGRIQVRMFKKDESARVKTTEVIAEKVYFGRSGGVKE